MPPSRWKVVERGRRLEVIDTFANGTRPAARGIAPRSGLPRRVRFDGTVGWTTHPFYDASGPRAVVLDGGLVRQVVGVALIVVAAAVMAVFVAGFDAVAVYGAAAVMIGANWKQVRPWLTRRLDAIAVP